MNPITSNLSVDTDTIGTITGKRMSLFKPDPRDVDYRDIVVGLSNLCRYSGQVSRFYSVAEHSCRVMQILMNMQGWSNLSDLAKGELVLVRAALLHDASEAYIADMPRPIKKHVQEYREIEYALEEVIAEAFGLPDIEHEVWQLVRHADMIACEQEIKTLRRTSNIMHSFYEYFEEHGLEEVAKEHGGVPVVGHTPQNARYKFLEMLCQVWGFYGKDRKLSHSDRFSQLETFLYDHTF